MEKAKFNNIRKESGNINSRVNLKSKSYNFAQFILMEFNTLKIGILAM